MLKLKTSKSARKRFKLTGRGKLTHRRPKQNHFNAMDSGNEGQHKKKSHSVKKQNLKDVANLMPYL